MKGFVVVSLGFVLGCGGWIQKSKTFIQSPFGKREEAAKEISKGTQEIHLEKGKNLFMEGNMKSALKEFNAAVRTDPDSPEIHYNLGLTYYELGRYSEAINAYQKAIQLKPDLAEAHFNLGVAYDQSGQAKNALQAYNSALKYGIDDAAIHFNIGLSYLKLSRLEEAKKELVRALEFEPNLAEAYNNLGYLAEAAGDFDLAVANYKKALAMKPDYKLARENMERLEKIPAVTERPPITKKKILSKFFLELDGKWAFSRDMEFETSSEKMIEIESNYQRALLRLGYSPVQILDIFLEIGATSMGFDKNIPVETPLGDYSADFKKILGLSYGAGLNADIYRWNRMNLGFDGGLEFLMGSNKDEYQDGIKATAEWTEYTLFIKTRYLGLNNLIPYGGFTFSKLDGTFELDIDGIIIDDNEIDFNESDPFGIFLGAGYYHGEKIRFQAEARFLDEMSLSFRVKYGF
jgi:Flp pilus assembly protein TadD